LTNSDFVGSGSPLEKDPELLLLLLLFEGGFIQLMVWWNIRLVGILFRLDWNGIIIIIIMIHLIERS
jgi:hypothetical protein